MKYQLVLQFNATNIDDFDEIVEIEELVANALGANHDVDGHDFGSGEMNIYIHTNEPNEAFEIVKSEVLPSIKAEPKAAYREITGECYSVLWPEDYSGEFRVV